MAAVWHILDCKGQQYLRRDTLHANDVFYYAQFQGNLAGTILNRERATYTLTANSSFTMPNGWSADLNGLYESR